MKHIFASLLAVVATVSATPFAADAARPEAPAAPILLPAADGSTKVGIRALAPSKDINGNPLSELISIVIYRDGKAITGGQEPCGWYEQQITIGEITEVFTDAEILGLTPGVHTYHFTATNIDGVSAESERSTVYIGIPRPIAPTNVTATTTSNPGEMTVSWTAPTVDFEGHIINPESLAYKIYDITNPTKAILVADEVSGTSYTWQAVDANAPQQMKRYRVTTVTRAGESRTATESEAIAVGRPLTLPYTDSFTDNGMYEFTTLGGNGKWSISKSGNPAAYDADKAVAVYTGNAIGDEADIRSCEITIPADAQDVVMSFYYTGMEKGNTGFLQVIVDEGSDFNTVHECKLSDGQWTRGEIDMSKYAGKTIRFGFRMLQGSVLVDNVRIAERGTTDVAIKTMTEPTTVIKGADNSISVSATNTGASRADNVIIELYLDDTVVATSGNLSFAPGETLSTDFTLRVPVTTGESATLHAVVTLEGDENTADNTSAILTVTLENSTVPAATGLTAEASDNTVTLSWSEPATADGLTLKGYNVYCDNVMVNTETVTATTFIHEGVADGTHTYFVTAVYSDDTESAPSNAETVVTSDTGIDTAVTADVTVTTGAGTIIVRADEGTAVEISAMDGRTVYSGSVNGSTLTVNVPAGIYAVRAAGTAAKLIVR